MKTVLFVDNEKDYLGFYKQLTKEHSHHYAGLLAEDLKGVAEHLRENAQRICAAVINLDLHGAEGVNYNSYNVRPGFLLILHLNDNYPHVKIIAISDENSVEESAYFAERGIATIKRPTLKTTGQIRSKVLELVQTTPIPAVGYTGSHQVISCSNGGGK